MASPFRLFRKYLKPMLVIFGVMLMFVFVIGDYLPQYFSGNGGVRDPLRSPAAVAVRWDGGRLTNRELDMLVMQRRMLMSFIRGVYYTGEERDQARTGTEPRPLRVGVLNLPEMPGQGVEQHVVQSRVFADAARRVGMTVSDETIVQYLDELGRQHVSRDEMKAMLSRMQYGRRGPTIDFMFDAIREELLARNYLVSYHFALETVTPEQRWRDWLRVNDHVMVEAAVLPVEAFVVDVPEPSEEELLTFFERYKEREPQPDRRYNTELPSPLPGFAIPRRIDVKYVMADYDRFLEKVEGEVTEEEIRDFYEANKDPYFVRTDVGLFDEPLGEQEAMDLEDEVRSTDDVAPAEDEADRDAAADEVAGQEEPIDEAPEQDGSTAPAGDETSFQQPAANQGVFQLAAFLQEGEDVMSDSVTDQEAAAEVAAENDAIATAGAEAPPAAPVIETPLSHDIEMPDAVEDARDTTEEPVEFQPLDDVRDVIRGSIAEDRATERLIELMNDLRSELRAEFNTYFGTALDAEAQGLDRPEPPAALVDLEALAEQHGLESGQTGPLSVLEFRDTQLGSSVDSDQRRELWLSLYLTEELELYQPTVTFDLLVNHYLVMKVDDQPGRVPELDEVRNEVLRAWKRMQAAELAENEAERLARQAQEAGVSLSDFFADNPSIEVVRTDPFSWFTGGSVSRITGQRQPFRLSEPDDIVAAGPEFMETVFGLGEGEVGAVLNHDHSIAYVVRVLEHLSTPDELRRNYLAEANSWAGLGTMTSSHYQTAWRDVVLDMLEDAGVNWERPPDQRENGDEW